MIAYASRTGTRRNLEALRAAGWRLMISAKGDTSPLEGWDFALDNGAWWAFQNEQPFDEPAFLAALERFGSRADWVVIPDIVAGGAASLELSRSWRARLGDAFPLMLAVQDGMEPNQVADLIGPRCGVFVGGNTAWKLETMAAWAAFAHQRGGLCHVGRVNTARRIFLCGAAGVDSFDGSSASKYAVTLPLLDGARRQMALPIGR